MAAADAWRFEWRRTWADVWCDEFAARWHELRASASASHAYHEPGLVRAWLDTIGARLGVEPMVGIAMSSSGARVLLPWMVVTRRGRLTNRRTLESIGGALFGYHTPLLAGAEPSAVDWPGFWRSAREAAGSACQQALFRLVEPEFAGDALMRKVSEQSPILHLGGCAALDDVLARCASSHRVDVRRQLKRVREKGELSLWIARPSDTAEALDSVRKDFWPAYCRQWAGKPAASAMLDRGVEEFIERIVTDGVSGGWTHYAVLKSGGVPVAWHLGFLDAGRLYYSIPTYDAAWSNYSPGKLLLAELIEHGCRERWREIHLLTGNHDYKLAWNPTPRSLVALAWTAPTVQGRAIGMYDTMARAMRGRH
jgi:CelD/BcsL family acetyltransferase involved in cellulose biosynthesis